MKKLYLVTLLAFALVSCNTTEPNLNPKVNPGATLGTMKNSTTETAEKIVEISDNIGNASKGIIGHTNTITTKDTADVFKHEVVGINEEVGKIEENRTVLKGVSTKLLKTSENLNTVQIEVKEVKTALDGANAKIDAQKVEIKKLNDSLNSAVRRLMMYVLLAGVVMIAVCVMLIVNGNGKAVGLGVAGLTLVVTSLSVSFFMTHLAIIGVVAGVITIGLIGYKIYEQYCDKRARFEAVKTAEHLKHEYLDEEQRKKEFGGLVGDGHVGTLQSSKTKALIREDRAKLAKEINPTV